MNQIEVSPDTIAAWQAITFIVALGAAIAIWMMRPIRGLVVYLVVLVLYPQYLAVSAGTVDLTAARMLGLILLVRTLTFRAQLPSIRFLWMDAWILACAVGSFIAPLITMPAQIVIVREGGHFVDFVVPYLLVRYTVRTRDDVYLFLKSITIVAIPLAIVGIIQTVSGFNLYGATRLYSPFDVSPQPMMQRYGLYRANGPFEDKISFGLFFTLALSVHIGTTFYGRIRPPVWLTKAGIIFGGIVSSMSSSPLFAAVASMGWIAVRPFRSRLPIVFAMGLAGIVFIEMFSDRHFYHVLTRFALNSETAYYRIELMEEALGGGMSGHWVAGYGYVGYGSDNLNPAFNWVHQDLANIYILRLATGGLLSLLPYLVLNVYYYWCLYKASRLARDFATHWMIWCVTAAMIGWNVAFMTVGALTQIQMLYGMMIGLVAVWVKVLAAEEHRETAPEPEPAPILPPLAADERAQPARQLRESWFRRTQ